ncbi:MAG: DNA primase [Actinomycetota bacterium]|nr:DNA primase [Actinomycetota bacterium]
MFFHPGGKIRNSDIEAVRERTDMVHLVSEYVPLKKSGKEFRGPCPFHKEKDPSFYVNPAKGVYYCFGCKASGGVFNFLMQMEGLNFTEAVEKLAERIGYQLTYEKSSPAEEKERSQRERLLQLNKMASDYYYYVLLNTEEGKKAVDYLAGRGFAREIIDEFHLGFAPSGWENACKFLSGKGFSEQELLKAGLGVRRQGKGNTIHDFFRSRVIFPILDVRGRVIAFGGRSMPSSTSEEGPKYLNSPETPVYRKSGTLYGLYQTRESIQGSRQAVVVEGYTDLLGLWSAGIKNVVATLGTALTEEHFRLLSRYSDRVYLAFDADKAGVDAAMRTTSFFGKFGLDIFVVRMPPGEDPASLVQKVGPAEIAKLVENAISLLDFALEKTLEEHDISNSIGRRRAMMACLPIFARVSGEEFRQLRDELTCKLGGILDLPTETIEVFLREAKTSSGRDVRKGENALPPVLMSEKVENEALRVLLANPQALLDHLFLDEDFFTSEENRKILGMLKELPIDDEKKIRTRYDSLISSMVERIEDKNLRAKVSSLLIEPAPQRGTGGEEVFERLRYLFFKRQKAKLELEVRRVNKKIEPKKYEALCNELFEIGRIMKEEFPYDHS